MTNQLYLSDIHPLTI